jgi:hypothetical protein
MLLGTLYVIGSCHSVGRVKAAYGDTPLKVGAEKDEIHGAGPTTTALTPLYDPPVDGSAG